MQTEYSVIILQENDGIFTPALSVIPEKSIPAMLNGESGFHICHVRMLTELILRQLKQSGGCALPEEDILAIAIASSLHDIGKMRIPKSILDIPGKLSPVEYDIAKKHAAFGAELIRQTDFSGLDPKLKEYAATIAKYHHERYDGTGYPDGLKGDDIPLCAQVVSLADAYDALTSSRSYKKAFSQDVAIQMITSGMCGIFNEALIDSLLKTVNHQTLVSLREQVYKGRKVVVEQLGFTPERVLCIGNTEYLTQEFVENTFPSSNVTVVGNTELGSADRIKLFKIKKPSIQAVLETYDFDLVVYFSGDLTFATTEKNDSEELREVLAAAKKLGKEMKLIFLSSLDSSYASRTDRSILSAAKENLCEFYAKDTALDIKVVQIPYLYSATYEKDFLYRIFDAAYRGKPFVFDLQPEAALHFICLDDLSQLLFRLVENWNSGSGTLTVGDDFSITLADFIRNFEAIAGSAVFEFTGNSAWGKLSVNNRSIRNEYGWFAKISLLEELPEEYEKFLALRQNKGQTIADKLRQWIDSHSLALRLVELFLLFLITEGLLFITDSAVIFSIVDFRMAYIVIMATTHGLAYGMAAAALSSVSWLIAKIASGTSFLTVFYEPTNWLAFVFFFLVGALCGYIKLRKEDDIRFVTEQNRLLEDKLVFTREIYEDTYREKRDLKKQIIGSKDSFGKIFDITRKLDTVEPQLLYLRTMETFEEVLENKSIAVYSVNEHSPFGRLEVASRDIMDSISRSISTETYAEIIAHIKTGEVWRNLGLKQELPMYAAGVFRGDKLVLLIFLWRAELDQHSLYYVNLFKILRDLVQMSLLRAFKYNQAIYAEQFLPNSRIMKQAAFRGVIANYGALSEKKVAAYSLLEVERGEHSLLQLEAMLSGKVRSSDILGEGENGNLQILLPQATEKDLQFVLPRFEAFTVTVLK